MPRARAAELRRFSGAPKAESSIKMFKPQVLDAGSCAQISVMSRLHIDEDDLVITYTNRYFIYIHTYIHTYYTYIHTLRRMPSSLGVVANHSSSSVWKNDGTMKKQHKHSLHGKNNCETGEETWFREPVVPSQDAKERIQSPQNKSMWPCNKLG